MYESYYGFSEKPFSLTPDPKFLYRSQSHGNAFDLLQYAIARREGFVVVTGDIGTGKTTLCRALLEQIDRTTFTALVLNPFLTEEDLLRRILQDFGVISREEIKVGRLEGDSYFVRFSSAGTVQGEDKDDRTKKLRERQAREKILSDHVLLIPKPFSGSQIARALAQLLGPIGN